MARVVGLDDAVDSGANHPGHLSGLKSQSHDGAHHNHWVMDDSPGQLRTRLGSSHASAELGLGELINHNPLASNRGAWRGQGVELANQSLDATIELAYQHRNHMHLSIKDPELTA